MCNRVHVTPVTHTGVWSQANEITWSGVPPSTLHIWTGELSSAASSYFGMIIAVLPCESTAKYHKNTAHNTCTASRSISTNAISLQWYLITEELIYEPFSSLVHALPWPPTWTVVSWGGMGWSTCPTKIFLAKWQPHKNSNSRLISNSQVALVSSENLSTSSAK